MVPSCPSPGAPSTSPTQHGAHFQPREKSGPVLSLGLSLCPCSVCRGSCNVPWPCSPLPHLNLVTTTDNHWPDHCPQSPGSLAQQRGALCTDSRPLWSSQHCSGMETWSLMEGAWEALGPKLPSLSSWVCVLVLWSPVTSSLFVFFFVSVVQPGKEGWSWW